MFGALLVETDVQHGVVPGCAPHSLAECPAQFFPKVGHGVTRLLLFDLCPLVDRVAERRIVAQGGHEHRTRSASSR